MREVQVKCKTFMPNVRSLAGLKTAQNVPGNVLECLLLHFHLKNVEVSTSTRKRKSFDLNVPLIHLFLH